jgi:hypothetical protein
VNIESTLWPLIKNNPILRSKISDKDLFPTDHMDIRPLQSLFDFLPALVPFVVPNTPLSSLFNFLNSVKLWYQIFNDNELYLPQTLQTRITILSQVARYFQRVAAEGRRDIKALVRGPTTLRSIVEMFQYSFPPSHVFRLGYFGSNINENLWSQVRGKSRYVTLELIFRTIDRAYAELVKKNCLDLPFAYPQVENSKCYNNQKALRYLLEDVPLLLHPKKSQPKKDKTLFPPSVIEIVKQNHPTRRQMTLRLGTCFENPYASQRNDKDRRTACPFSFQSSLQVLEVVVLKILTR